MLKRCRIGRAIQVIPAPARILPQLHLSVGDGHPCKSRTWNRRRRIDTDSTRMAMGVSEVTVARGPSALSPPYGGWAMTVSKSSQLCATIVSVMA